MRLWHYKLLPYLPRQQLLGQWRELNSIYLNQNKHILINYVYEYDYENLLVYSRNVIKEMMRRNYKVNENNCLLYFCNLPEYKGGFWDIKQDFLFVLHHNDEYLKICCWNLYEKYIRGQKGFTDESIRFIKNQIGIGE